MNISVSSATDVGLKREKNEDSYLVDTEIHLYVVADGMGGHRGGDVASKLAVRAMRDVAISHINNVKYFSPQAMLEEAYIEASSRIFEQSKSKDSQFQGMGTTLVSAFFYEDFVYFGNVGDSRVYFMNDQYMWQVTEDHSLLNEHIKAGLVKDNEIANFQAKNVITRSVGFEQEVRCDIFERKIQPKDRYLLCSDGLSGLVEDERVFEICKNNSDEEAIKICIEEAKKNGGDDNITAMILSVDE